MSEQKLDYIVRELQTITQTDSKAREVIFAKIDRLTESQAQLTSNMAVFQAQLKYTPRHDSPCETLTEHIKNDHAII